MRLRGIRVSTRFFIALGVLLLALAAMVGVGLHGLAAVEHANDQVVSDNLLTAEATSRVASDLARAEALSLEISGGGDASASDQLRIELDQAIIPQVDASIAALLRIHAADPPAEQAQVERIPAGWHEFASVLAHQRIVAAGLEALSGSERASVASAVRHTLEPLIAFVSARRTTEIAAAAEARADAQQTYRDSRTWLIIAALLAVVAAATMIRVGLVLRRLLQDQSEQRGYGLTAGEYTEMMQATENEDEAHDLLRRQVERTSHAARAVVLVANNSDDRLEPRTSLDGLGELRDALEHATPRSCLAVRFARGHVEGGERTPLVGCQLCGCLPGVSMCTPLLVNGQVTGSVLASHPAEPAESAYQRVRETVAQAAPVLANLRNLAIAELRAATDRLTGLPNQRAVQDTLKRMVAQASRTITPLAAVLVDLDNFKEINDIHGHDRGDEVLAAVGVALRSVVRDSDFVGRYGGEEFLLLLPSTDKQGALQVAEAVRASVGAIRPPRMEQPITASAGVAVLPNDAGDGVTLFRAADRALYAAKKAGRNRVHGATEEPDAAAAAPDTPTSAGNRDPDY
jgi:diguanylate cyclase (GGDEF)-like protein